MDGGEEASGTTTTQQMQRVAAERRRRASLPRGLLPPLHKPRAHIRCFMADPRLSWGSLVSRHTEASGRARLSARRSDGGPVCRSRRSADRLFVARVFPPLASYRCVPSAVQL